MIEVADLTVERGGVTVLESVSLSVAAGELVGLVGPNGAGKTTLLHAINGVLDPVSGRVRIEGVDTHESSAREVARLAATVPQDTSVGFDFSVEQIVEMGRTPYLARVGRTDPHGQEAVERALERTDTAQFADRPIGTVSGGQRQRVLLARALAQETPALLLDEPTASLDVNHQVRTLELVEDVVAGGKGALAAIHDLDLAARFCDRLVLLSDGGVLASGPPRAVLDATTVGETFDTDAAVATDTVTGQPTVRALRRPSARAGRVHVFGSGPSCAQVLAHLDGAGLTVTTGPLPPGDVATDTARARDVEPVTAPPFSELDERTQTSVRRLVTAADVAVVLPGTVDWRLARDLLSSADTLVAVTPDGTWSGDWPGGYASVTTPAHVLGAVLEAESESAMAVDDSEAPGRD